MKILALNLTPTLLSLSLLPSSILAATVSSSTDIASSYTAPSGPAPTNRPFTVIVAHSTSPIHLQPIQAQDEHFFINNGGPSTYCPIPPLKPEQCPLSTRTVFIANGGGASLAVSVPGGQQIYVTATGALSYTSPHSHSIPADAALGPFTYTPPSSTSGNNLGHFGFTGLGATGFVACPVGTNAQGPPWQVFANVKGGEWGRCIGFDALASEYRGGEVGAWEYT